ncbi:hypothetical protein O9993_10165 [Vibrio lentus]|nr:hypothetical protein [Vibrio lentus]
MLNRLRFYVSRHQGGHKSFVKVIIIAGIFIGALYYGWLCACERIRCSRRT